MGKTPPREKPVSSHGELGTRQCSRRDRRRRSRRWPRRLRGALIVPAPGELRERETRSRGGRSSSPSPEEAHRLAAAPRPGASPSSCWAVVCATKRVNARTRRSDVDEGALHRSRSGSGGRGGRDPAPGRRRAWRRHSGRDAGRMTTASRERPKGDARRGGSPAASEAVVPGQLDSEPRDGGRSQSGVTVGAEASPPSG